MGQAAPALADAGPRIRASSTGVTTGFHSGFGGSARSAGGSPAAGSSPAAGGDQSHNGRSADSGSAAAGSGPVASAPATSAAVPSAVAASSAACPGQLTGASRTGSDRSSLFGRLSPSGPLGPEERQAGRTFRRTLGFLSLRPCPVVCCPAVIAFRHQRS